MYTKLKNRETKKFAKRLEVKMGNLVKIRELSTQYDISARTLRYYEDMGLIESSRSDGYAYRMYDERAVKRLEQILILRRLNISVKDIKRIFSTEGSKVVLEVLEKKVDDIDGEARLLHELKKIILEFIDQIKKINFENQSDIKLLYEKTKIIETQITNVDYNGNCISGLSMEIQNELIRLDHDLLSNKKLKIKRKIEGNRTGCKITYVSPIGFSYALLISENLMHHFFWWYMVSNYKYENKYMGRKNDFMNEMLRLADSLSPEITERLVSYFDPCVNCRQYCSAPTQYEYRNKKIKSCHGKIWMNMDLKTFSDIRFLFDVLFQVLAQHKIIS